MKHTLKTLTIIAVLATYVVAADDVRDAILDEELRLLREAGVTEVPTESLPDGVAAALGLEPGSSVSVEILVSPEVQDLMLNATGIEQGETVDFGGTGLKDSEALRTEIEHEFGPGAEIILDDAVIAAFRDHTGDPEGLRDSLESAVDGLPDDLRGRLRHGFLLPGEHHVSDAGLLPYERRPTDEVLDDLDPLDRALLEPHRDVLDDPAALGDVMNTMTDDERRAAVRFRGLSRKQQRPIVSEYDEAEDQWRRQNFREFAGPPRGSAMLAELEQAERRLSSAPNLRHEARSVDIDPEGIASGLARVPTGHAAPESRNFVMTGPDHAVRLYSKSMFNDALLLVEQIDADAFHPRDPNLMIAGRPANVAIARHGDGSWTTTVAGFDGKRVHHVTVETRLDGDEREAFVRFATEVIENASLLP